MSWIPLVLAGMSLMTALGLLLRYVIRPLLRLVLTLEAFAPVMHDLRGGSLSQMEASVRGLVEQVGKNTDVIESLNREMRLLRARVAALEKRQMRSPG